MSKLVRSGGFAPAQALVVEYDDTFCCLCDRDAMRGWVHISSQLLVCTECMSDPEANDGAVGVRTSERVKAMADAPIIW
jgi:hypothetical protein